MLTLVAALAIGILVTPAHRAVVKTRWPWLGGGIALVIWLPNLAWQVASGWPQLTMASALHQQNNSAADYVGGLPLQLLSAGLLGIPLAIAGFITLWRAAQLRFLGVTATLIVVYVLVWIPGKAYYVDGILPATGRRVRTGRAVDRHGAPAARPASGHGRPCAGQHRGIRADHAARAADREPARGERDRANRRRRRLAAAGRRRPSSPVPTRRPARLTHTAGRTTCRQLVVYNPPDQVKNDWNDLAIGIYTGPTGSWKTLWPDLKHYD